MTTRFGRDVVLPWLAVAIASVPIVAWSFTRGVVDLQYELAGLANPFLGNPAPGFTIAIALILTALVAIAALAVRVFARRIGGRQEKAAIPRGSTRIRARWWLPLAGGWAAYALGAATVVAGGGLRTFEGTMRFEFGTPVGAAVDVPAVCTTPVGKPDVLAEVGPSVRGLPRLRLLNIATGAANPHSAGSGSVQLGTFGGIDPVAYPLPNLPARPLPHLRVTSGDGRTRTEPPIGLLAAYHFQITRIGDPGLVGYAKVVGTRWTDPLDSGNGPGSLRWIDLEIPNDPWPQSLDINIFWTCRP